MLECCKQCEHHSLTIIIFLRHYFHIPFNMNNKCLVYYKNSFKIIKN